MTTPTAPTAPTIEEMLDHLKDLAWKCWHNPVECCPRCTAIRSVLLSNAEVVKEQTELKAEVDELATKASHLQHDLFCEERDRKKAEAELAAARPLLDAVMGAEVFTAEGGLIRYSLFPQMKEIIEKALAYRAAQESKGKEKP